MTESAGTSASLAADGGPSATPPLATADAVVVGAGLGGLCMMNRLRAMGMSVQGYEAGPGLGGTWYWNRYPGARVDIRSLDYSYSFDSQLEQDWEWTEKYATQPELLRYIEHVADRLDLRRDIAFNTRVTAAVYDDEARAWTVRTERGQATAARFLIMATGCLSVPKDVDIPGLDSFAGPVYRTYRWPRSDVRFDGERVGVIGTGSSGVQVIPIVAEQAAELHVFQRTANYVVPANNHPLDPAVQRAVKARYPEVRARARRTGPGVDLEEPTRSAFDVTPEDRRSYYDRAWNDPDNRLHDMYLGYTDTLTAPAANEFAASYVRDRIDEIVHDPSVAEMLKPDHPFGAKRPCLGTGYYETFNRANVHLVDIHANPIVTVTEHGLTTAGGQFELDTLVLATGFDAMTGALRAVDIRGPGGISLRDKWNEGPVTYLGLQTAGFPNLFMITGPGSPSVLSNMVTSIEQHVEWIGDAIQELTTDGLAVIEATPEAERRWTDHVAEAAATTLFPEAKSWYIGANVPGKAAVFMPYVAGVGLYGQECARVAAAGYEGFERC